MPAPQRPDSRLGKLRALFVGDSTTETVEVADLTQITKAKNKLHHIWSTPCVRVRGKYTRSATAALVGNKLTATITITRIE